MTAKFVTITISAIDRLTGPARKMQDTLNRMGEPVRRINQAVGRMGDATGVTKLSAKFKALGHQVTDVRERVGGLVERVLSLGGLSLGAAAGGLLMGTIKTSAEFERYETILRTITGSSEKAKSAMNWISDFARTTPYELAETTDAFVRLKAYGLDPMDGTLKTLGNASAAMGKRLDQAVEMIADASTGEFERLKEFGLKAKTQGDVVSLMFTDKDQRQRTFTAAKNDSKALQRMVLDAFKAKGFDGAMDNLSRTWDGLMSNIKDTFARFFKTIGDAGIFDLLKSRLQRLLDTFDRLSKSGQLEVWAKKISDEMSRIYLAVEKYVLSIDWEKTWQGIKDFASGVAKFVELVGGWKNAIIGLVILLNAGLIVSLVELGVMLAGLAPAIAGVGMSLGALAFGPVIAAVGNFITALRAGYGVVAAFNMILAANPIGLVIVAVAALAAAAFLVVKNWGAIKAWFAGLWDWLSGLFSAGVQGIVNALMGVDLFAAGAHLIGRLWDGLKALWPRVTAWFSGALQALTGWLPDSLKARLGLTVKAPAAPGAQAAAAVARPAVRAGQALARPAAAASSLAAPSLAVQAAASPAATAAQRQASGPAPARGPLPPAAVTQQVHAPVQVAVTINGLADVAVVHRTVEDAVRVAIRDWEGRRQGDTAAALYDS